MGLRSFFGILSPRIPYPDQPLPVEEGPSPEKLTLLLEKGALDYLAVSPGKRIQVGENLLKPGKGNTFPSPAQGEVETVEERPSPNGETEVAVTLRPTAEQSPSNASRSLDELLGLDPSALRQAVTAAGFSCFAALSPDVDLWPRVETLVVSALDQDPDALCNQQAFRESEGGLLEAVRLLSRASQAKRTVLAVPPFLASQAGPVGGEFTVMVVSPWYPHGFPAVLARMVAYGTLLQAAPAGVRGDTLVVGVEQALAIRDCLMRGTVLSEKIVTFYGPRAAGPKNLRVRIGTHIADLLAHEKVDLEEAGKLVVNGLMRGFACLSDQRPVTALTDSVRVQTPEEVYGFAPTACTNCGRCTAVCPVGLEVHLLARCAEYGLFERCIPLAPQICVECGLCAYLCPARRPLVQWIVQAKKHLEAIEGEGQGPEDVENARIALAATAVKLFEPEAPEARSGEMAP